MLAIVRPSTSGTCQLSKSLGSLYATTCGGRAEDAFTPLDPHLPSYWTVQ
jgi:hypothetical protein